MKNLLENLGKTETRAVLAILTTACCFLLVGLLMVVHIPKENVRLVDMSMGFLLASGLAPVYGYFFGASKAEADKMKGGEK